MSAAFGERRRDLAGCGISVGSFLRQPQGAQPRYFGSLSVLFFLGGRPVHMYIFCHLESILCWQRRCSIAVVIITADELVIGQDGQIILPPYRTSGRSRKSLAPIWGGTAQYARLRIFLDETASEARADFR